LSNIVEIVNFALEEAIKAQKRSRGLAAPLA
jgi:hypothetical protein